MTDPVRCMLMRGGSSKGLFLVEADLPLDPGDRDQLVMRLMGTPDERQIDGLGGAHPLSSKVAIVGQSEPSHDQMRPQVDYLFLQVGVGEPVVSDHQNCGNMLAGVGPFAVERGLVDAPENGLVSVRIRMVNTNTMAVSTFAMADGVPFYAGVDASVDGVPGRGAPIRLEFEGIAGGSCGAMLPTGNMVDSIDGVECTLIDNGMPVVVMRARDFGVSGAETCAQLEANGILRSRLETIRRQAGEMMNLGDVRAASVPKLTLVSPPGPANEGCHLNTRTFIPHRCHDAIGVLGAVSVATAALLEPSPAAEAASKDWDNQQPEPITVVLGHPTGSFSATVELTRDPTNGQVSVGRAGTIRTARKLMDGVAFPRHY